ncbi:MAG: hypothetical protein KUG79_10680 [Pseudomonadales bacterium]|nr:hypothetical protein [Pseudomonadales bacterium]
MRRRREIEGVSLSFLDVVSCGFGAIILLLVLTKVFEPVILEDSVENLEAYLAQLKQAVFEIRGETNEVNRKMIRKEDQDNEQVVRLAELQQELNALKNKVEQAATNTTIDNTIKGRLASAKQKLTEEMQRLLGEFKKSLDNDTIGGIPVDSEYVILIIDTSGSMDANAWPLLMQKVDETLQVYPKLKGIQVMSDMGNFMFTQYTNEWIPDTQARRRAILDRLETWRTVSVSNPVAGITKAISVFYKPDRKISLYIFGDEFTGSSIQRVIDKVDRINRVGQDGNRLVRIHAIGFPVVFAYPAQQQSSGIRFAILMRELCARNGGTFVALNDYRLF